MDGQVRPYVDQFAAVNGGGGGGGAAFGGHRLVVIGGGGIGGIGIGGPAGRKEDVGGPNARTDGGGCISDC
jgi:hypothetical protein